MSKALYIAEKPSVAQEFAKALKINGQRRHHRGLLGARGVGARRHVLQELRRRHPRLAHEREERREVALFERPPLRRHAPRLLEVVERAQGRAVAQLGAHAREVLEKRLAGHVLEPLAPEALRDGEHVGGDGHELVGVTGVVAAAVHKEQGVPACAHVEGHGGDARLGAGEVEGHDAAEGARQLVLGARGLAEVDVLGPRPVESEPHEAAARVQALRIAERADQQARQHLEGGR